MAPRAKKADIDEDPFHPRKIEKLHGHERSENIFLEAWHAGRLPHAWLITGPKGIGKATFAYNVARFVLAGGKDVSLDTAAPSNNLFGEVEEPAPSGLHISPENGIFKRVVSGGHSDFMALEKGMINPATNRVTLNDVNIGVVRKAIDFTYLTPAESDWRVVVIDSVDEMNRNAANAVLKVLEEPPNRALFILVSHAPGRILPTIRSRCRRLNLSPLDDDAMSKIISHQRPSLSADEVEGVIALSNGSAGAALRLCDAGGVELHHSIRQILSQPQNIDMAAIHLLAESLGRRGQEDSYDVFKGILDQFLQNLIHQMVGHQQQNAEKINLSAFLSMGNLEHWLEVWENTIQLLGRAGAPSNLDRKQLIISAFSHIAGLVRY
jgi:DNA polymerase-3 subunit delta'